MTRFKTPLYILAIVFIVFAGWMVRSRAVSMLSIDFDEDDYLRASQEYAHLIRTSDWSGFLETNYRPEHPPLAKIVMGLSLLSTPEEALTPDAATTAGPNNHLPRTLLKPARTINAIFGTLTVFLLAIFDPLAGILLATHTFTIKYVSQVMLEALPALTSLITVLAYIQSKKGKSAKVWLVTSAVFLGLTAASKYLYCLVAVAILIDWFWQEKQKGNLRQFYAQAFLWGIFSILVFFAADPYLWPAPIERLKESVLYHAGYSTGASEVKNADYPIWQPFVWVTMSPTQWHPGVFLIAPDFFITLFAIFGIRRLWKKERVFGLWLAIAFLFLLVWPTKWPQYILMLTVPLSFSASQGIREVWLNGMEWWRKRKSREKIKYNPKESRQAIPWLVPGLIAFTLLTLLPFIFQLAVSVTDFNRLSIRDGFQGGIWREFLGGITGQIAAIEPDFPFDSNKVQFTGLASYGPVFDFLTGSGILVFNIIWASVSIGLQTTLGLGLALLLHQRGIRFGKFWQAIFILPWAIPELIGALLWLNIFVPDVGFLALAAQKYGAGFPLNFLIGWERTPNLWFFVLLIPAIWYGFPLIMLASSASLKMIPTDVFEAAAIDGATIWETFRYITLPLLMPLLLPALIIRAIFAFNQFYLLWAFQYWKQESSTLALLSYNLFNPSGPFNGQFSASAIVNIITVIILIGFVALFNRETRSKEELKNA
jgi:arabinogalactan oligomer/maltooligosaccharide transport system permease protein